MYAVTSTTQPSGSRRLSWPMLAARESADRFQGVPKGTAQRFRYLAAFQAAEPYLGLPAHSYKLVSWLVGQTMPHDWEEGSRPIAWPSARLQQEFLGLSPARVKALNRALFEAGIFVIRDNEQGKRYGRRDAEKRIVEAYGFDLSPLALRCEEFIRFAAEAKLERDRMKDLRRRVTIARRAVRSLTELLTERNVTLKGWPRLVTEVADLVVAARTCARSLELADVAEHLEALHQTAEGLARDALRPVETDPEGLVSEPHFTSTNSSFNLKDTVIAAEESSEASRSASHSKPDHSQERRGPAGIKTARQLLELVPNLDRHVHDPNPGWREIVDAAGGDLRHELGVSISLWHDACRVMGREGAALALAIVSTKDPSHFTGSPGAYFGGMVRKAEKGELYLERTIWGLREAKWGRGAGGTRTGAVQ